MSAIREVIPPHDEKESAATAFITADDTATDTLILFRFDPNTASLEELKRLGLKQKVAQTIINYRNRGGKFRSKEDLKKIYGLTEGDYLRLEHWVSIRESEKKAMPPENSSIAIFETEPNAALPSTPNQNNNRHSFSESTFENPIVDVNQASQEEWQKLKGIGPAYSRRIVNFRDKLGGFYSIEQVGETQGLPDSVFQKIKPWLKLSPVLRKIDLNNADLSTLQKHPYLSFNEAKVLYNYVQQHAPVRDMAELRKAMSVVFKQEKWAKLEPYLDLSN